MIYDILDTKPILLPPQLPPSPTCSVSNNVRQGVSNYDDTPDNVSGDSKERPSNPSVDADSLPNTEQGIIIHVYGTIPGKKISILIQKFDRNFVSVHIYNMNVKLNRM